MMFTILIVGSFCHEMNSDDLFSGNVMQCTDLVVADEVVGGQCMHDVVSGYRRDARNLINGDIAPNCGNNNQSASITMPMGNMAGPQKSAVLHLNELLQGERRTSR